MLTISVSVCCLAGSPAVVALIEICEVPDGVVEVVAMFKVTEAGFPLVGATVLEGWYAQLTPAGNPEQESTTES